ncbi:MAG TPA: hypothetical protein VGF21_09930 [Thermoleophilaceae bacterium]|jgi:hypothetical protein
MVPLLGSDLLGIYLNDHLAGATGGLELARRAQSSNAGTPLGDFLAGLVVELEEDREALERIMDRLGVGKDRLKVVAGWTGEKAGRLKLNGRLTGYSPLSRLVEVEALLLGVSGKRAAWLALLEISPREPRLDEEELQGLVDRAEAQLGGLRRFHAEASAAALSER